jgi:anti-sigma B factor antagonist
MAKGETMNIDAQKVNQSTVVLAVSGRLDTANAPIFERKIKQWGEGISGMIIDFSALEYISSMGLRVLLQTQKAMKEKNIRFVIKNMNESVKEVFEITGFLNLMVQEERFVVVRKDEKNTVMFSFNGDMKSENVPEIAKELSEIKEQKSFMDGTNERAISNELADILERGSPQHENFTVIMDMKNLDSISPNAVRLFHDAVADTNWKGRKLVIQNASDHIDKILEYNGMNKYLA